MGEKAREWWDLYSWEDVIWWAERDGGLACGSQIETGPTCQRVGG